MRLFLITVSSLLVISSASAATVVFQIPLDPGQASPAPAGADNSTGQATVTLDLDTSTVTVAGSYENMSSNVVAAHIHGLAAVGATAGVIVPLDTTGGTSGTVSGSGALSADDLQGVLDGRTYVNIHTQNNGPGEIRGQIVNQVVGTAVFEIDLTVAEAIPAPVGAETSTGQATVTLNTENRSVTVSGNYENMSSNVVAAHIHGLAAAGEAAGVIVPLDATGGTSGTLSGTGDLSPGHVQAMLNGLTYVNVHTANNGPGEIRGQIMRGFEVPLVSLLGVFVFLSALLGGGILALRRRRDPSD